METLRAAAYNPSIDETGYNVIKRYYCQLHSLQNRFPIENDRNLVSFVWRDIYSNNTIQSTDLHHDMAVVLYNYGAIHTQVGATVPRTTEDEMKLACTLFQRAAWAFETIRERYQMATTGDMYPEIMIFMQNICFAQAQECFLEKSLMDNRKPIVVAKVASQIIEYYNSAFAALLSGGEEGMIAEIVGSRQFKDWRQYIQFKVQYTACILFLYQGQYAEEENRMGERVTLYQAAFDRLEDARKEAKHLNNMSQVNDALTFVMDIVEAKRRAAKNENEFIYHDEVPEISSIARVPGAVLVKGIPFNIAETANEDIFHRLVPIQVHERNSLYSEEKTNLLRRVAQKIEEKDGELNEFMESLNINSLSYNPNSVQLPQSIIDRCAAMNARPTVIDDLIQNMSSLAETCVDVENVLQTIQELLSKEESYEKEFQQTMGYRPSGHFIELNREFMKYQEAHNKAGDSNDTLRKAMEMHVNNLRILSKPLVEVQAAIPTCSVECDPKLLSDTQMLLNKVNEMRVQRAQIYAQLNENIQRDDMIPQLVAYGEGDVENLFRKELGKHDHLVNIIEQNLVAQKNILKSFTDAYAKCAHFIKIVSETKHKRDIFFSSLITSYDVYDDLLDKSLKGLEFYKKMQSNIHKLFTRVRSARDVHDEERQQRIDSMNKKVQSQSNNPTVMHVSVPTSTPGAEYPKSMKPTEHEVLDSFRSAAIRPTPIGQENTGIHTNQITHDINHSSMSSTTTPYNYNYQSTVSATVPANYTQPAQSSISTPSSVQTMTSAHSSQPTAGYNTQYSQPSAYAPSSGYVNPIYNNMGTSLNQPKQGYGTEMFSTEVPKSNISSATVGAYGISGMHTTNPSVATMAQSGWNNNQNYNSMMTGTHHQQNLPVSSQPQTYLHYSQSATHQAYASRPTVTNPAGNVSSLANPNLAQSPTYTNASYTDYTSANNHVNAYQMPPVSQYSLPQPQQTTQVSQNYSHSVSSYMQAPQQIPSSSVYTNYASTYSTPPFSQANVPSATNDQKLTYPTSDAYSYYNAQYGLYNNPTTNQYYGHEANHQSNQYNMPAASGYLPINYNVPTNVSIPNSANVYNYGVIDPSGSVQPAMSNYTTIQQAQIPTTPTQAVSAPNAVPSQSSTFNPYVTSTIASTTITGTVTSNQSVPTNVIPPAAAPQLKTEPQKFNSTKFDLMSDLDNIPSMPAPTLQPITIKPELITQNPKPETGPAIKPDERYFLSIFNQFVS